MFFIWDDENIRHTTKHGVKRVEAEQVVRTAKRPYPRRASSIKWMVRGRAASGRALQVVYLERLESEIDIRWLSSDDLSALQDGETAVYIIHARPLRHGED